MSVEVIILLTACLIAINTSLLGSFLVLKKMSMLSDAISHSVLPGIVIAYLVAGNSSSIVTLLFASFIGLISVLIIEFISKNPLVKKDAAIGMVYTFLFSVGIILISLFAKNADIDAECVLFGDLVYVPFSDGINLMGASIPYSTMMMFVLTIIIILILFIAKKGFILTSFDPSLAHSLGVNLFRWNFLMLALVSVITVFSFQSVGAIMVISLLVIPPSFAKLFAKRLKPFLILSIIFSVLHVFLGYYVAALLNINTVATISFAMGITLLITILIKRNKS